MDKIEPKTPKKAIFGNFGPFFNPLVMIYRTGTGQNIVVLCLIDHPSKENWLQAQGARGGMIRQRGCKKVQN